jgi:hypothetical protein
MGLTKTEWLQTTNGLALLQYGVVTTTNVCGWDFPREFYLAQSWRGVEPNTNVVSRTGWELQYVAKGRVTSIHAGKAPQIPAEVLSNLAK